MRNARVKGKSLNSVNADPTKAWRSERLGLMQQAPEYKALPAIEKKIVNYLVRAHESEDEGITVAAATLAKKYGVHLRTMQTYLREIDQAGVFTSEPRRKGRGSKGGQTSNRRRLSPAILAREAASSGVVTTSADSSTYTSTDSPKGYSVTHAEAALLGEQRCEALQLENRAAAVVVTPAAREDVDDAEAWTARLVAAEDWVEEFGLDGEAAESHVMAEPGSGSAPTDTRPKAKKPRCAVCEWSRVDVLVSGLGLICQACAQKPAEVLEEFIDSDKRDRLERHKRRCSAMFSAKHERPQVEEIPS